MNKNIQRPPRELKPLTPAEQKALDLMHADLGNYLYTGLAGQMQIAGHQQVAKWASGLGEHHVVLDIGCGQGHHLKYSSHTNYQYIGIDMRHVFLKNLVAEFPSSKVTIGLADQLPFASASIDYIVSVYVLEHLWELEASVDEMARLLKPSGELLVGLPAEGGFLYGLGRNLTSKPYVERKYKVDYDALIKHEHCNTFPEVRKALLENFTLIEERYVPFSFLPSVHTNIVVCLRLKRK